jgi:hypothetical protein
MATFSKKMGGKEVGDAAVYAKPHTDVKGGGTSMMGRGTPVTIGPLKETKTTGIKMRGAGAATRGFMSRGPMA